MPTDPVFWKMRNGELIDIDKMDIDHLRKALKMIVRNSIKRGSHVLSLNGDMAQQFNESQDCDATEFDLY